ncbi:MAG: hypothetical protein K2M19_01945 [Muribaculaceae bacterium]|nr:hypothetical protein [Muribaculaceae bacterium]
MDITLFAIECLKRDIEMRFFHTFKTPADFKLLSLNIKKETGEVISESTLQRIWGYSKSTTRPRLTTLTTLARCLDFIDWDAYVVSLIKESRAESDFVNVGSLSSDDLHPSDRVRIVWMPERSALLEYIGDMRFRVLEAVNAKLRKDDTFVAHFFRKGSALTCFDVRRGEQTLGNYIAGEKNGLTEVVYLPG